MSRTELKCFICLETDQGCFLGGAIAHIVSNWAACWWKRAWAFSENCSGKLLTSSREFFQPQWKVHYVLEWPVRVYIITIIYFMFLLIFFCAKFTVSLYFVRLVSLCAPSKLASLNKGWMLCVWCLHRNPNASSERQHVHVCVQLWEKDFANVIAYNYMLTHTNLIAV